MNTDDRRDLVSGFAAVLEDTLSTDLLLEASLAGGQPQALRATMAEMGWFDLALDESHDGLGLEVGDLAALSLVTGYHLLPIPLLIESFVLAPVLAAAGPTSADWLAALRSGTAGGGGAVVAPALDAGGVPTVDGVVVALAPDAERAVVLGRGGAVVVDIANAEVERLEGTDLMSGQSRLQGLPGEVVEGVELVLRNWIVCALADCIGSAQAALDLALDYAKEREQFGSPIAKFQAISHMLADMRANIELSLSSLARLSTSLNRIRQRSGTIWSR